MTTDARIELDGAYRQLREEAGLVRRPSRRVLAITGADAVDFLQGQLTNDVEELEPGDSRYAALLDRKGHIQSDVTVTLLEPDRVWLVAESEGADRLARHLGMYRVGRDVEVEPVEADVVSVIGAAAPAVSVDGVSAVTTPEGIDLLPAPGAVDDLIATLAQQGIPEVEEEAAEILRVESGLPRLGREMTTETMPAEAGIVDRTISFTKGCYIGQETVARLHYKGRPNRHLRGLRLADPAAAGDVVALGDREVGRVGTAVLSPAHGPLALAVLRREAEPGASVKVGDAGAAEVADLASWPDRQP